jgi:hypothetical protein
MTERELKDLWNGQASDTTVTLDDVKQRAAKLERQVRRRNLLEWGAAIFVVAFFGLGAWRADTTLELVGNALVVAAALFVSLYLWRNGRIERSEDPNTDTRSFVEAHAATLRQQARLIAAAPLWYVGPFALGLGVLLIDSFRDADLPLAAWLLSAAIELAILIGVALINLRGARQLRRRADDLLSSLD